MRSRNSVSSASGTLTVKGRIAFLPAAFASPAWVVPVVVMLYSFEPLGFRVEESGLEGVCTRGRVGHGPAALVAALRIRRTAASLRTLGPGDVQTISALWTGRLLKARRVERQTTCRADPARRAPFCGPQRGGTEVAVRAKRSTTIPVP